MKLAKWDQMLYESASMLGMKDDGHRRTRGIIEQIPQILTYNQQIFIKWQNELKLQNQNSARSRKKSMKWMKTCFEAIVLAAMIRYQRGVLDLEV